MLSHTVYVLSLVISMIHGMSLSIMASGLCFSSPLKIPSECVYVNSLIFCERMKETNVISVLENEKTLKCRPSALIFGRGRAKELLHVREDLRKRTR